MSYYQGLQAESVPFRGHNGDQGEAYYARPSRAGKFPGIVIIHQELMLVPELSVAENIFLGNEITLPGERSARTEAARRKSGIPIPTKLWEQLERIAKAHAVRMPAEHPMKP